VVNSLNHMVNSEKIKTDVQLNVNNRQQEINTNLISTNLKKFIAENKIQESYFSQKILRASFLTFKNIVDFPQEWSLLNESFKLYFKRANIFLNDIEDQEKLIRNAYIEGFKQDGDDEKSNMLLYDISRMTVNDEYCVLNIIENVVSRLKNNSLNRKILCDAVLGIPTNTFSFFCTKNKKWSEQSEYAKEAIMRMIVWYNDPNGIKKLSEWKEKFYTSEF
jgi:hypothetical protein